MPLTLQAKMLRALESQQVLRVGGLAPRTIDVRFVAATNRNLEEQVRAGRFREDLYFRLNGALVVVPPLRERVSEIEPLAAEFIRATCIDLARRPAPALRRESLLMLQSYAWPGNVRELKNFIERAVLVAPGAELLPEHFPIQRMASTLPLHRIGPESIPPPPPGFDPERERILAVLAECGGNQPRAAKALGISRTTLVARLNDYGSPARASPDLCESVTLSSVCSRRRRTRPVVCSDATRCTSSSPPGGWPRCTTDVSTGPRASRAPWRSIDCTRSSRRIPSSFPCFSTRHGSPRASAAPTSSPSSTS